MLHRMDVRHPAERRIDLVAANGPQRPHEPFSHRHDVLARDERGLDVDLGELRLSVGTKIFVAKTASDLKVAVEAGHHEELLEQLR